MSNQLTWTIALPIFTTIFVFARSRYGLSQSALERWFGGSVLTLAISSLLMVGLLSSHSFTPFLLLLSHSALAVVATLVTKASLRPLSYPRYSLRQVTMGIAILLVAILFRLKPASHLYGGQDPGVYTNAGNYIAQHGTRLYADTTLPIVKENPQLLNYYLESTYLHANKNNNGDWVGNLFGGLYIHDLTKGESVFQFYPGTEIWLAFGSLLFGPHQSTWIFLPFSLLTILAVGLLTYRLTKSSIAGFSASALLAINPAHAAISTSPLSEPLACLFFLSGTYFLVSALNRHQQTLSGYALSASALAFGALFFTRITGFLTLPLILGAVFLMATASRGRAVRFYWIIYGTVCAALYLLSFLWGLTFSYPYSRDIFSSKLGITAKTLEYIPHFVCVSLIVWSILILTTPRWASVRRFLRRSRNYIGWIVIGLLLLAITWKGYQLGFTDTYVNHRWFSKRWQMAGKGWRSIAFMSFSVLSLIMSPPGLVIGLCGVAFSFKKGLTTSTWMPICTLATCFLIVLTLKPLTVPYLYYFARYQVSELLPLLIITGTAFVHHLIIGANRRAQYLTWTSYLGSCAAFLISPALARLQETEGLLYSRAIACIDALSSDKTIIALDKAELLVSPIVTPLRLTYGKKTIGFKRSHFRDEAELRTFFEFFTGRGYDVLVLSGSESWSSLPGFTKIMRIPTRMRKLGVKRGEYRLPHSYSGGLYPVRVFRYLPEGPQKAIGSTDLPAACQQFLQEPRTSTRTTERK